MEVLVDILLWDTLLLVFSARGSAAKTTEFKDKHIVIANKHAKAFLIDRLISYPPF